MQNADYSWRYLVGPERVGVQRVAGSVVPGRVFTRIGRVVRAAGQGLSGGSDRGRGVRSTGERPPARGAAREKRTAIMKPDLAHDQRIFTGLITLTCYFLNRAERLCALNRGP